MRITTEQLYYIREKAKVLQRRIKDYKKTLGLRETFSVDESAALISVDAISDEQYQKTRNEYKEIMYITVKYQ